MLRISQSQAVNKSVTLRLEGRIVGPWVLELGRCCDAVLTGGETLRLHLAEVAFMDAKGVALLSCLQSRGVTLVECPPFAAEQLRFGRNRRS